MDKQKFDVVCQVSDIINNKNYSKQQKEYLLYEYFLNNNDDDNNALNASIDVIRKYHSELQDITAILTMIPILKKTINMSHAEVIKHLGCNAELSIIDESLVVMKEHYKTILDKTIVLSNELGISNSLELLILFSYILYY